jgi:hypothetical protein
MGSVKLPYYIVKKGFGYFQPSAAMRRDGAKSVPCGNDGPEAWKRAAAAFKAWNDRAPDVPTRPAARAGTLRYAFERYRATDEWSKAKSARTREEWERCWNLIGPAFGDCQLNSVTLENISEFRTEIESRISLREAHRAIKIWRALWKVAVAFKMVSLDSDPSKAVTNTEPALRKVIWSDGEVRLIVRGAWKAGYYGLAALAAVMWDTSYSPVDARLLTPSQRRGDAFVVSRAKTGREAIGTLTRRSARVLRGYLAKLGVELAPNAPIFRNRSGAPYSKDTLGDDFRDVRALVFGPGEKRTLADMRRSGTVEAIRGGAEAEAIGNKLGNSFGSSAFLQKTYAPTDMATVLQVDEARRKGRKK